MAEDATLHSLDKRVTGLEDWRKDLEKTIDLKIENAGNKLVVKILLGAAGLLALQSVIERVLGA